MKEQGENSGKKNFFLCSKTSEFCETFKRPVANLPAFYHSDGELGSFLFDSLSFPEAGYKLLNPSYLGNNEDHATENGQVLLQVTVKIRGSLIMLGGATGRLLASRRGCRAQRFCSFIAEKSGQVVLTRRINTPNHSPVLRPVFSYKRTNSVFPFNSLFYLLSNYLELCMLLTATENYDRDK